MHLITKEAKTENRICRRCNGNPVVTKTLKGGRCSKVVRPSVRHLFGAIISRSCMLGYMNVDDVEYRLRRENTVLLNCHRVESARRRDVVIYRPRPSSLLYRPLIDKCVFRKYVSILQFNL